MAKPRKSKRQLVRDERRKKKRDLEIVDGDVDDNYGNVNGDPKTTATVQADEPAPKRRRKEKVHISASGANNTPLATRGDGALFFDDVHGKPENILEGQGEEEAGEAGESSRGKRKRDEEEGGDAAYSGGYDNANADDGALGETEFFGLLTDSEHEYFRRADELLELNDFAGGDEERRVFLANVFREARGKELKVASSQSCSRLMERLIQVASVRQKKRLFAAFRGHILTLVSHRFSSHCCEQLFLQSAPWVGRDGEDGDDENDEEETEEGDDELPSLEESFLFVLDELEASLGSLLVHRFASHTLRVLLVILAGRPLDGLATQTLLRSKRKENVRVGAYTQTVTAAGPHTAGDDTANAPTAAVRIVPDSFTFAMQKILGDVSQAIDGPLLHVLPTHPTGNPSLQLLLELDMAEKKDTKGKKSKKEGEGETEEVAAAPSVSLLERLLPGAPGSLAEPGSQASTLIRTLIYDPIGSRLLETLIVHCPGKLFKALYNSIFAYAAESKDKDSDTNEPHRPMAVFLRNDIACYPSMRVIERLGRDDLTSVVQHQVLQLQPDGTPAPPPESNGGRTTPARTVVGQLVDRGRYNVLRTLFERCAARGVDSRAVQHLVNALQTAIGGGRLAPGQLVKLCLPEEPVDTEKQQHHKQGKRSAAAASAAHVCHLLSAMLAIPGGPASAVQAALLDVEGDQLAALAAGSHAGARVLMAALQSTPSLRGAAARIPLNKQLVARLVPHCMALATSPVAHVVLVAIVQTPSRTEVKAKGGAAGAAPSGDAPTASVTPELSLPFHLKDTLIAQLAANEDELRQSWCGRAVWRAWKGDLWRTRRSEWVHFAKAGEPEGLKLSVAPMLKEERQEREREERFKREKEQRERGEDKTDKVEKKTEKKEKKEVTFERPVEKPAEKQEEIEDKMDVVEDEVEVEAEVDDAAAKKAKKDAKKAKKEEKKAEKEKKKEKKEKEKKEKKEKRKAERAEAAEKSEDEGGP